MSIELPSDLSSHLIAWLLASNPKGNEDAAADIKSVLCDLVDAHTISRATIERDICKQLSSFKVYFGRSSIEISDSDVTLHVNGKNREGSLTLDSSEFDSSDELSRVAGYAEELENSVWDDDAVESLIEKWFDLER